MVVYSNFSLKRPTLQSRDHNFWAKEANTAVIIYCRYTHAIGGCHIQITQDDITSPIRTNCM